MNLDSNSNCVCDSEFTRAGDSCILNTDKNKLEIDGFFDGSQYRVTYFDVWDGTPGEEPREETVTSDVMT